jgi:hypothetical protein
MRQMSERLGDLYEDLDHLDALWHRSVGLRSPRDDLAGLECDTSLQDRAHWAVYRLTNARANRRLPFALLDEFASSRSCQICDLEFAPELGRPRVHLRACAHAMYCAECIREMESCPLCRTPISNVSPCYVDV